MSIVIASERQYLANIGKSNDSNVPILAAIGNGLNLLLLMTFLKNRKNSSFSNLNLPYGLDNYYFHRNSSAA